MWLLAAVGLLAVACMVKEPEQDTMLTDAPKLSAFTSPATRASVSASDGQKKLVAWDKGDEIAVFMHNEHALKYVLEGEGGEPSGVFSYASGHGFGLSFPNVYGVYPYGKDVSYVDGALKLTIPAEQAYAEKSFDPKANVMVAASTSYTLQFKNLCGYLVLRLYGEVMDVKSVTLKGYAGEVLAGPATAYAYLDDAPELELDAEAGTTSICLTAETPVTMGASPDAPTEFWIVVPPMAFEEGFEVRVMDAEGHVARGEYTMPAEIKRNEIFWMDPLEVLPGSVNGHAYVEMAPGLFLAATNVGASEPEEYGDFFAWGETMPKDEYSWATYQFSLGILHAPSPLEDSSFDKYNPSDALCCLEPEDDAATAQWGKNWHTPSQNQWAWLMDRDNCTREWTTRNDTTGYLVTSKAAGCEGNQVFLPAGGYKYGIHDTDAGTPSSRYEGMRTAGYYWSSEKDSWGHSFAYNMSFGKSYTDNLRFIGGNVRPVYGTVPVTRLELDREDLDLVSGQGSAVVTASFEPAYADVCYSIADPSVASIRLASTPSSNGSVMLQIHAQSEGETTLTFRAGDQEKTCKIVVSLVQTESLSIPRESYTVLPGMYVFLEAQSEPALVSDPTLTWTSSDPSVAEVNEYGSVATHGKGSATITVTASNGVSTSCTVHVADELESSPFGKQWWVPETQTTPYTFLDYMTLPNRAAIRIEAHTLDEVSSYKYANIGSLNVSLSFVMADGALGLWHTGGGNGVFIFKDITETGALVTMTGGVAHNQGWLAHGEWYPATVVSPQKTLSFADRMPVLRINGTDYPMWTPGFSNIDDLAVFRDDLMGGDGPVTLPLAVIKHADGTMAFGEETDFEGMDLTGKIAVVSRGGNSFYQKAGFAESAGAAAILIINNVEGTISINLSGWDGVIPAFALPLAAAEAILDQTEAEFYISTDPLFGFL